MVDENSEKRAVPRIKGLPTTPRSRVELERLAQAQRPTPPPATVEPPKPPSMDSFIDHLLDEDDEDAALSKIKEADLAFKYSTVEADIDARITRSIAERRKKYPRGGLKAYQFLTFEILRDAPAHYFLRFEEDVREITNLVQGTLSEKGLADHIGDAQANPLDDAIQDKAFNYVQSTTSEFLAQYSYRGIEKYIITYMVSCDILGLSRLDPLWRDRRIDEIICNGPHDVQVEVRGQLFRVPGCQFRDARHLSNLLERLFGSIGKALTKATPLVKGRLYDNSRLYAVHQEVAPEGPNMAIRRHPENYWRPVDLVEKGSASVELMTEIGNLIHKGCSYIVIGGTSTGKTSLLNATSGFFDEEQRVISLEDNLELKLNPKKLIAAPMECREPNPQSPNDRGVTMRDLVKASLQMRPDGIVIGEVTDGAMYDLCQALNTGHWGASTVHANSPQDGIYRMVSLATQAELIKGEAVLPLLAAAFDFIIYIEHFPVDGSRKITSVSEINPYTEMDDTGRPQLGLNPLWEFIPDMTEDQEKVTGHWAKVGTLSDIRSKRRHLHLTPDLSWEELLELSDVPQEFQSKDTEK